MKIGTVVAVCHDGKWSRRVKGVVTGTRRGHHIRVAFPSPGEEHGTVEIWMRLRPKTHWRYKSFGGWADDLDCWMPWFSACKWRGE